MLLARGQPVEGAHDVCARQARGVLNQHPFQHLCERGAAGERRRASVSEKSRGFYPSITQAQTEAQAVSADRVGSLGESVGVRQFACAARVRDVVFEDFRVRQDWVSGVGCQVSGSK